MFNYRWISLLLVFVMPTVHASQCLMHPSWEESFVKAKQVYVATLTEVAEKKRFFVKPDGLTYTLNIDEVFKGDIKPGDSIDRRVSQQTIDSIPLIETLTIFPFMSDLGTQFLLFEGSDSYYSACDRSQPIRCKNCLDVSEGLTTLRSFMQTPPKLSNSWLTEANRELIRNSQWVQAKRLEPMLSTPRVMMPGDGMQKLNDQQVEHLKKALLSSNNVLNETHRFSHCEYRPGVQIRFINSEYSAILAADIKKYGEAWALVHAAQPEDVLDVLWCANCGIWAVAQPTHQLGRGVAPDKASITHFGDAKEQRSIMLTIYEALIDRSAQPNLP